MSSTPKQVSLTLMGEADAEFVLGIRNDISTRAMLHDARAFTAAQFSEWFGRQSPEWLIISDLDSQGRVGYARTKWIDDYKTELQVGVDIHPGFRRQGYARAAFEALFLRLRRKMVGRVSLEVLDNNPAARSLYEELGFSLTSVRPFTNGFGSTSSTAMRKELVPLTRRQCKVIACWFGPRRAWGGLPGPEESHAMYRFLLSKEFTIGKGKPCDTILVVNVPRPGELKSDPWFKKTRRLVKQSQGRSTADGVIRVIERPNIGLSFGAFDHAYHEFANEYDFWHFLEDDHIIICDGLLKSDYEQFKELDQDVGFIASVGCSSEHAPHCHGGCGLTSRTILDSVAERNYSEALGRNHLPFYYNLREDYDGHIISGEIPFTSGIAALGLRLMNSRLEKFVVNWRAHQLRNCHGEAVRFVEWTEAMRNLAGD